MRTVRCSSRLPRGGVSARVVCLRGVCPGECLLGGGGVCPGGVSQHALGRGVSAPVHAGIHPPLFGQNSWHTLVKTLPFRNYDGDGNNLVLLGINFSTSQKQFLRFTNSTSLYHIYITSLPCSSLLDQILEKLNILSQLCLQITLIRSNIQWHHNELIRNRKKQGWESFLRVHVDAIVSLSHAWM